MDKTTSAEPPPAITIRRDWQSHRWVYGDMGSHIVVTPFVDTTPAINVVLWLKTNANGRLTVRVDLS